MTTTEQAIELRKLLSRACSILDDLSSGTTDEQDAVLYDWQTRISVVANELTEQRAIDGVYDRQAVIDATL